MADRLRRAESRTVSGPDRVRTGAMDEVLAFDVNETLLDLAALDDAFAAALGAAAWRPVWFQTMLQVAFAAALAGTYVDFATAQRAALDMVAARAGRSPGLDQREAVLGGMRRLPAHAEVPEALAKLRVTGARIVALTNSPLEVARDQLTNAGLAHLFDDVHSADEVRELKPGPAPYRLVAERAGVTIDRVRLIAAHAWDVTGALSAGARAAFVARGGAVPTPLDPRPDVIGVDLAVVADALA
jgi:2-haloacid dehalogenase